MSIESHYNSLKYAAEYTRSVIVDTVGDLPKGENHIELKARIRSKATELAAQDWPRLRSLLAAKGEELPIRGAREFHDRGYMVYGWNFGGSICASRQPVDGEPDYVQLGYCALRPDLAREADAAEAAFEAYRRAVEQGVAIDPNV